MGLKVLTLNQRHLMRMGKITEIRWHGRGGQGAVLASRILAKACFLEGKWTQAFPFFGAERRGAPVMAFSRISDEPIKLRSQIYYPDVLVFLDPMFLSMPKAMEGFKESGILVVNTERNPEEIRVEKASKVATVPATSIAVDLGLAVAGLPIPNTVMVGAVIKATGLASLNSAKQAIKELIKGSLLQANERAVEIGYKGTKILSYS